MNSTSAEGILSADAKRRILQEKYNLKEPTVLLCKSKCNYNFETRDLDSTSGSAGTQSDAQDMDLCEGICSPEGDSLNFENRQDTNIEEIDELNNDVSTTFRACERGLNALKINTESDVDEGCGGKSMDDGCNRLTLKSEEIAEVTKCREASIKNGRRQPRSFSIILRDEERRKKRYFNVLDMSFEGGSSILETCPASL